ADEVAAELGDALGERQLAVFHGAFADAVNAGAGFDLHEHEVRAEAIDHEGSDGGDFDVSVDGIDLGQGRSPNKFRPHSGCVTSCLRSLKAPVKRFMIINWTYVARSDFLWIRCEHENRPGCR